MNCIHEWNVFVLLDSWTEEQILCLSASPYSLTNYLYKLFIVFYSISYIGLSNGYIRLFNTQTYQLVLYTITPANCSIKKYDDTSIPPDNVARPIVLSVLPLDYDPNYILITYRKNGVFLFDLSTHSVLLHYKQPLKV